MFKSTCLLIYLQHTKLSMFKLHKNAEKNDWSFYFSTNQYSRLYSRKPTLTPCPKSDNHRSHFCLFIVIFMVTRMQLVLLFYCYMKSYKILGEKGILNHFNLNRRKKQVRETYSELLNKLFSCAFINLCIICVLQNVYN